MTPQRQLDEFVRQFCTSLEVQYASSGVKGTRIEETDEYLLGIIEEETSGEAIELWSEDDQITLNYSLSHWHFPTREPFRAVDPRSVAQTCQQAKQAVLDLLSGSLLVYSVRQGERALGGGSIYGTVEEAVQRGKERFSQATSVRIKQWCKELVVFQFDSETP